MGETALIRRGRPADAAALATLAETLGYPTTPEQMQQRLQAASAQANHAVFIAEEGSIVGWAHASLVLSLESGLFAEIHGLVVAESRRGSGIGKQLVAAAEGWAIDKGCDRIRVRTNSVREGARQFYKALGYQVMKTQEVFSKSLTAG